MYILTKNLTKWKEKNICLTMVNSRNDVQPSPTIFNFIYIHDIHVNPKRSKIVK